MTESGHLCKNQATGEPDTSCTFRDGMGMTSDWFTCSMVKGYEAVRWCIQDLIIQGKVNIVAKVKHGPSRLEVIWSTPLGILSCVVGIFNIYMFY